MRDCDGSHSDRIGRTPRGQVADGPAVTSTSRPLTDEQRALWQRVLDLWAMSARRDDAGIRRALHPDYAGWDMQAVEPHDRDAAVHSASGDSPTLIDHVLEPLSIRVYEGVTGVAHYRYAATVAAKDGRPRRVTGRWTEVYAKSGDEWRMVAVSGQPDAPPSTAARIDPARLVQRAATPDDALCLGVLGAQVFLDAYATQGIRPTLAREVLSAFTTEACRAMLAEPQMRVLVAELDGHLIGFAQLALGAAHPLVPAGVQAELRRLYVQRGFSGQGVGRALLRGAERLALESGAAVLWLTAWVQNSNALAFYAHLGYRDCGASVYRFEDESYENRVLARRLGTATTTLSAMRE